MIMADNKFIYIYIYIYIYIHYQGTIKYSEYDKKKVK